MWFLSFVVVDVVVVVVFVVVFVVDIFDLAFVSFFVAAVVVVVAVVVGRHDKTRLQQKRKKNIHHSMNQRRPSGGQVQTE